MARILTIDLGTTYFKISLFDRSGRLCDTCRIAPPTLAVTGPGNYQVFTNSTITVTGSATDASFIRGVMPPFW